MPKLATPLSDIKIRTAKPKEKAYKLADGGGLYLLVNACGSKYWCMDYRFGKVRRTLRLGQYPQMTLADVRNKRIEARRLIDADIDPCQHKREQKRIAADKTANTFEKLARQWYATKLSTWSPATAKDTLRRLELDIFPQIGALPIASISPQQMIAALRKVEDRGALEIAHRLKATCARVFSYANQMGIENRNPAQDLKDVLKTAKSGHFAAIGPDELPAFLRVMNANDARLYKQTRIAMQLMLLVFVRTSELTTTPWSEIDLEKGEWTIPWRRMKRGKLTINPDTTDHYVPLSHQAIELLKDLHTVTGRGTYLFPNQRHPTKPMSNGAILAALKRMGYQGKMTGHGFRALAITTLKERLGYRHETVDRQLAHAQRDKVANAYDRATFLEERKKMMQDWADYLDGINQQKSIVS
ncbi:MAG: tyrosine-type recombinase/integrase [Burkholderiaceae bacterium]